MFSRRRVLAGIAAGAALGPAPALAGGRCVGISETVRECTVGIQLGDIETVRQRCENWCWAACIQTIFELHGHGVAQESAVLKLFGDDRVCEGANDREIVAAINGSWVDQFGFPFTAQAEILPLAWLGVRAQAAEVNTGDPQDMALAMTDAMFGADDLRATIDELANGNPLILGTDGAGMGHAVVLTAATFLEHVNGNIAITELVIRDPWGESQNRRTLTADEVRGTMTIIKVSVSA